MSESAVVATAIRTRGLTKHFGTTIAVADLDLTVTPGEVFGFPGPNGAGKSTTIRLLLGLIRPSSGSAEIFGEPAADVRRAHRHLAYVPAGVALWPTHPPAALARRVRRPADRARHRRAHPPRPHHLTHHRPE
ncbi:MAG: ATP-binding cassette domain-containing protein [Actinophytocola sp.]|uniref:ATP-binding cassette domain-containing protein n=1 Tax=Actinophytocola sp. TaxID=1872138 RepID=UPI0013286552|nr:ATP-binding cassette domain-containing protein [Actinophytocola sp.]